METSIFLSKILGIFFTVLSLSIFFNLRGFEDILEGFLESPAFLYMAGLINFLLGLLIVHFHNVWVLKWNLSITLLGLLLAIKGGLIVLFPQVTIRWGRRILFKNPGVLCFFGGVLYLALGIFFGWMGYGRWM